MRTLKAALLLLSLAWTIQADAQPARTTVQAPPLPPATPWPREDAREIKATSGLLDFVYSWPVEAASIPKLNALFEAEAAKAKAQALSTAREDKAERGKDVPFSRHESKQVWTTVGDTSRLLSMVAEIDVFVGGAERNSLFGAKLWDRKLDRAIEIEDLFDDPDIAFTAMNQAFCRELDRQRVSRGGEATEECRPLDQQVIAPAISSGSGWGRFDRFRVLIDPFNAGSLIEGSYQVDIPITDQVRSLVKPEYATFFAKP